MSGRVSPRWLAAGYAVLLLLLAAFSSLRLVGDGAEYVDMASRLASLDLAIKYAHFWLYPLVAAPFVWICGAAGVSPLAAFLAVNVLLLTAACGIVARRLAWPCVVLIFVGPIVWWSDKAHTEVFTFSLLAMACALLADKPWWSLVCLGAAAAQNLPIALLVPLAALAAFLNGSRDRRLVAGVIAAIAIVAINPVHYYLRMQAPLALAHATTGRLPTFEEAGAVLFDLNLGLVWGFPVLVIVLTLALAANTATRPRWWRQPPMWFSLVAAIVLLAVISQARNVNHGGTPGLSRYALWFIPLAIPWLHSPAMARLSRHAVVVAIVILSAVWSIGAYRPSLPENHLQPSALARWVWRHLPSFDNPSPETFIERLRHADNDWFLPVATSGCEKILIAGRGPDASTWPRPCPPVAIPDACRVAQQLCYANRRSDGYRFVVVNTPPEYVLKLARDEVWTAAETRVLGDLLARLRWWELGFADRAASFVRATHGVDRSYEYSGTDRVLVYFKNTGPGAAMTMRPPAPMRGEFIDLETGTTIGAATYEGAPSALWNIGVPEGRRAVALVLEAKR